MEKADRNFDYLLYLKRLRSARELNVERGQDHVYEEDPDSARHEGNDETTTAGVLLQG